MSDNTTITGCNHTENEDIYMAFVCGYCEKEKDTEGKRTKELTGQLDAVRDALQPFVDAYDRAKHKESWAASYLNNNAWKKAKQALEDK